MLASAGGRFFRTEGVIGSTWRCLPFNRQTSFSALAYYCYRDFYQLLFFTCCWFGHRLNFCIPDRLSCCFQSLARVSIGYAGCILNECHWISGSLWFARWIVEIWFIVSPLALKYEDASRAGSLLTRTLIGEGSIRLVVLTLCSVPEKFFRRTLHCLILNRSRSAILVNCHVLHASV